MQKSAHDVVQRMEIVNRLVQFMAQYGYQVIDTPLIESAELFLTKAGYQLIDQLLTFDRLGRELTLRPEFTAGALYHYLQQYPTQQPITRWQFNGVIFQDTLGNRANGSGAHSYQRYSVGAELIGMDGPSTEAEIISMAVLGLEKAGVPNWRLIIGHVGLMRHMLEQFALDNRTLRFLLKQRAALKDPSRGKAYVLEQLDHYLVGHGHKNSAVDEHLGDAISTEQMLDVLLTATERGATMGGRTREEIARRLMQKRQRLAERSQIVGALDFLARWAAISAPAEEALTALQSLISPDDAVGQRHLAHWAEVLELVKVYDVPVERILIQPDLARSWDYYTGIVFEMHTGDGQHLGGGGRYDELAHLIGDQRSIPAVGFAYYIEQLLKATTFIIAEKSPVAVGITPQTRAAGARWAHLLRCHGVTARLLPLADLPGEVYALQVQEDGSAVLGSRHFYIDTVEELIAEFA